MSGAPRYLYLHGFASGPNSTKGVKLADPVRAGDTIDVPERYF